MRSGTAKGATDVRRLHTRLTAELARRLGWSAHSAKPYGKTDQHTADEQDAGGTRDLRSVPDHRNQSLGHGALLSLSTGQINVLFLT